MSVKGSPLLVANKLLMDLFHKNGPVGIPPAGPFDLHSPQR